MTQRQLLLRMRDSTAEELCELDSSEHKTNIENDWSDFDAVTFARHLKDLAGAVTPLDIGLANRGLSKLCH